MTHADRTSGCGEGRVTGSLRPHLPDKRNYGADTVIQAQNHSVRFICKSCGRTFMFSKGLLLHAMSFQGQCKCCQTPREIRSNGQVGS